MQDYLFHVIALPVALLSDLSGRIRSVPLVLSRFSPFRANLARPISRLAFDMVCHSYLPGRPLPAICAPARLHSTIGQSPLAARCRRNGLAVDPVYSRLCLVIPFGVPRDLPVAVSPAAPRPPSGLCHNLLDTEPPEALYPSLGWHCAIFCRFFYLCTLIEVIVLFVPPFSSEILPIILDSWQS